MNKDNMKQTKEISFWKPTKIDSIAKRQPIDFSKLKTPSKSLAFNGIKRVISNPLGNLNPQPFGIPNPKSAVHPINVQTKNIPKREMNWFQAKTKYPKLNPFGDADRDGVINMLDCKPFNKNMQEPKGKLPNPFDKKARKEKEKETKELLDWASKKAQKELEQMGQPDYSFLEKESMIEKQYRGAIPKVGKKRVEGVPDTSEEDNLLEKKEGQKQNKTTSPPTKKRIRNIEDITRDREKGETEGRESMGRGQRQKLVTKGQYNKIKTLKKLKNVLRGRSIGLGKIGGKQFMISMDDIDSKTGRIKPEVVKAYYEKALQSAMAGTEPMVKEEVKKVEKKLKEFEKLMNEAKQPKKLFRTIYTPTQAKGLADKKVLATQLSYMGKENKALTRDVRQLTALVKSRMKDKQERIEMPSTALKRLSRIKRDIEKLPDLKPQKVEKIEPLGITTSTPYSVTRELKAVRKKPEDYFKRLDQIQMKPEDYRVEPYGYPSAQTLVDTAYTGREKIPKKNISPYEQKKTLDNVRAILKRDEEKRIAQQEKESRKKVEVIPGATLYYPTKEEAKREKVFDTAANISEKRADVNEMLEGIEKQRGVRGALQMIKQKLLRKEMEPVTIKEERLKDIDLNIRQTLKDTTAELKQLKKEQAKEERSAVRKQEKYEASERKRDMEGKMIDLTESPEAREKPQRYRRVKGEKLEKPELPELPDLKKEAKVQKERVEKEAKVSKSEAKAEAQAQELQKMIEEA